MRCNNSTYTFKELMQKLSLPLYYQRYDKEILNAIMSLPPEHGWYKLSFLNFESFVKTDNDNLYLIDFTLRLMAQNKSNVRKNKKLTVFQKFAKEYLEKKALQVSNIRSGIISISDNGTKTDMLSAYSVIHMQQMLENAKECSNKNFYIPSKCQLEGFDKNLLLEIMKMPQTCNDFKLHFSQMYGIYTYNGGVKDKNLFLLDLSLLAFRALHAPKSINSKSQFIKFVKQYYADKHNKSLKYVRIDDWVLGHKVGDKKVSSPYTEKINKISLEEFRARLRQVKEKKFSSKDNWHATMPALPVPSCFSGVLPVETSDTEQRSITPNQESKVSASPSIEVKSSDTKKSKGINYGFRISLFLIFLFLSSAAVAIIASGRNFLTFIKSSVFDKLHIFCLVMLSLAFISACCMMFFVRSSDLNDPKVTEQNNLTGAPTTNNALGLNIR